MPIPFVTSAWGALGRLLRSFNQRSSECAVHTIEPDESKRLLHDVDLYMGDMSTVLQGDSGRVRLLDQRLTALRLDSTYLKGSDLELYRNLQRACLRCASWRLCARDLARGNVQAGLEGYCPNSAAIDQFLVGEVDAIKSSGDQSTGHLNDRATQ